MNERVVVFDCETTIRNHGNPFDPNNRLCCVGVNNDGVYTTYEIEYGNSPYGEHLDTIRESLESADLVVGFNLKFDLNWLRRYLGNISIKHLWDCQLGAYLLSNQRDMFPSLNNSAVGAGLGSKLDVVKLDYWDKGIDTTDIPWSVLEPYLRQDVELTRELQRYQASLFRDNPSLYKLFQVGNEDLRWLAEAEWNGLPFDVETSNAKAAELVLESEAITCELVGLYNSPNINWDSSDHISIVLFGGSIYYTGREQYTKELKAGPVLRERNCWVPEVFPQHLKPDKRTENAPLSKIRDDDELAKINQDRIAERKKPLVRTYSVAEDILRNYKPKGKVKRTIEMLLRRSELKKLISTYYSGIPEIMVEHGWEELHGNFNQSATRTGRLSSSKPNLQNFAGEIKNLFRSRYE